MIPSKVFLLNKVEFFTTQSDVNVLLQIAGYMGFILIAVTSILNKLDKGIILFF